MTVGGKHVPARRRRSSSWRRRTRSSRRGPTRCPRPSSTASCSTSIVDYPSEDEELEIVEPTTAHLRGASSTKVLTGEDILAPPGARAPGAGRGPRASSTRCSSTRMHAPRRTRGAGLRQGASSRWGAGPRARQYLILGAQGARAPRRAGSTSRCEDVRAVAHPVLRHRIITNFTAEARGRDLRPRRGACSLREGPGPREPAPSSDGRLRRASVRRRGGLVRGRSKAQFARPEGPEPAIARLDLEPRAARSSRASSPGSTRAPTTASRWSSRSTGSTRPATTSGTSTGRSSARPTASTSSSTRRRRTSAGTSCSTRPRRWRSGAGGVRSSTTRATSRRPSRTSSSSSRTPWACSLFDQKVRSYVPPALEREAPPRAPLGAGPRPRPPRRTSGSCFTTWRGGSSGAGWSCSSPTFSTIPRTSSGAQALPPPQARGHRLPRARPARGRLPL